MKNLKDFLPNFYANNRHEEITTGYTRTGAKIVRMETDVEFEARGKMAWCSANGTTMVAYETSWKNPQLLLDRLEFITDEQWEGLHPTSDSSRIEMMEYLSDKDAMRSYSHYILTKRVEAVLDLGDL